MAAELGTVMSVVVVGNFDGVHQGHRKLISCAKTLADEEKTGLIALTFEPHPRNFFAGEGSVGLLTPPALKEELLLSCGADRVVFVRFDQAFSSMSAGEFLLLLKRDFACSVLVCGENSRFGRGGKTTAADLPPLAEKNGIRLSVVPVCKNDVSSSRIRELISFGRMEEASKLLGRPYLLSAPVVEGNKIGRTIGFPTLNQPFSPELLVPPFGVYVTLARFGGKEYRAVSDIGVKPTVGSYREPLLETHLLDVTIPSFIPGEMLRVSLLKMLRREQKFHSLEELKKQISFDCELAQKYFQ